MAGPLRILSLSDGRGSLHMATDVALLHLAPVTTLRFYVWNPPAVSLGWFQQEDTNLAQYRALGYDIVRRPTGGGAVAHHHELTYAFITSTSHPMFEGLDTTESYDVIHRPIIEALESLGIHVMSPHDAPPPTGGPSGPLLCFDRTASVDLLINGRKVVGSAQRRITDRLLQHGSIILKTNAIQSDSGSLTSALGASPSVPLLVELMTDAFARSFGGAQPGCLSIEEVALACDIESRFVVR